MRKLVVSEWVTLDGVFDAKTMKDWFMPFDSEDRQKHIKAGVVAADAFLLGKVTYKMLASYWSPLPDDAEGGLAGELNKTPKFVVSSKLKKADWNNSTIIKDKVTREITKLKQQPGKEIQVIGSATLVQSLMKANLVDEFRFLVHPVIIGRGKPFFKDGMRTKGLELVSTKTLALGVMSLTYKPIK
ncbi:MAG TPA: dihydrofolate reductase family protein [Aestuariivirga sp.]|nr:dihydrofolate reductase family protein [Aestuariivirga sp.]